MKALTLHAPPTTKERGILFSGAMVRALLAGKKTQTRRAVKPSVKGCRVGTYTSGDRVTPVNVEADGDPWTDIRCPYDVPRLWVRETTLDDGTEHGNIHYRADATDADNAWLAEAGLKWTPSLLMPRSRSRLTLAVESIRIERAQAISDADVEAEGVDAEAVEALWAAATLKRRKEAWPHGDLMATEPWEFQPRRELWRLAWTLINGRASWDANPWVWVVSFRRLP